MVYVVVNDADETVKDYQSAIRFAGEALLKVNNIKSDYIPVSYTHLTLPTILLV